MRRGWWLIFGACAVAVVAALSWITVELVRLDRAERVARAEADRQEGLRLALWRMDSWFAAVLAREAARPSVDYRSGPVRGDQALPSLLTFESPFVRLHFQQGPDGRVTSPQVPTDGADDLVVSRLVASERLAAREATLARVRRLVGDPVVLQQCVAEAEAEVTRLAGVSPAPLGPELRYLERPPDQEWAQRQQAYLRNTLNAEPLDARGGGVSVGPLVPVWSQAIDPEAAVGGAAPAPELLFVRRVRSERGEAVQGFLCDWPGLRVALLAEVADLFPRADLVPVATSLGGPPIGMNMLATIPARFEAPPAAPVVAALDGPVRSTLVVTWGAVLAALAAAGFTLRASLGVAERRTRFASAVTHELRTPLTTFRMYAEMLAEGMVDDEARRQTYLETLRDEADRLAALVENVLAYARLERGAARVTRESITLGAMVERVRPTLERLARRAGMSLETDVSAAADEVVRVDVDAVGQVLFNLVDNAGKYAGGSEDRRVHLETAPAADRVTLRVRDHGPGIPARHARTVFAPFERGAREPGDGTPGVGLGLALARGLARALGGDLRLGNTDSGACFELSLPRDANVATLRRHAQHDHEAEAEIEEAQGKEGRQGTHRA